jgi:subtilisin family serine protease
MFELTSSSRLAHRAAGLVIPVLLSLQLVVAQALPPDEATAPPGPLVDLIIGTDSGTTQTLVRELQALGVSPTAEYVAVFSGVAVTVTEEQLADIRDQIETASIATDGEVVLFATETQQDSPWNLDRIDQQNYTSGGSRAYSYPASAGAGVNVYVLDTGFTRQNAELDGRVAAGADFAGGDHGTPTDPSDDASTRDCQGHGTHVAGTIAATTYGAAKSATIVPVRVFGCAGTTTTSNILNGIEWVINNRPGNVPAVINMSLGTTGGSALIDQATQSAIDSGITVIAAAGNGGADSYGDDACFGSVNSVGTFENGTSPARVVDAITVGATGFGNGTATPEGYLQDVETYFSNYGTCVDVLAPGGNIPSLAHDSSATRTISGTSMAAPLVAGAAALYLGLRPLATPAQVRDALVENAAASKITYAHLFWPQFIPEYPTTRAIPTENRLLNTEFLSSVVAGPSAPLGLSSSGATASTIDLTWSAPEEPVDGTIADYRVQFRLSGSAHWLTFGDELSSSTSAIVTGLSASSTYEFRVAALADEGVGTYSASVSGATLSGVTSAPQSLVLGAATATSVPMSWLTPAAVNGGTVTDYRVQFRLSGSTTWSTFGDDVSSSTSTTVTGLLAKRTYEFRVAAITAQGVSAYTSSVSKATLSGVTSAPRTLAAGTATMTSIPVTWAEPAATYGGTITDYRVQFRRSGTTTWSTFSDGVSSATGATVTGLTRSRTYQFRVAAITAQGVSAYTSSVSKATLSGVTSAPQSLATGEVSASSVPLTWDAPSSTYGGTITDYRVQFRRSGTTTWSTFSDGVSSATGATVTGLSAGRAYEFRVAAITAQGTSGYSARASASTAMVTPP